MLIRNHEITHGHTTTGAFGDNNAGLALIDRSKVYDLGRTPLGTEWPCRGGCTRLVYDTKHGELISHRLILAGTEYNCAGGPTHTAPGSHARKQPLALSMACHGDNHTATALKFLPTSPKVSSPLYQSSPWAGFAMKPLPSIHKRASCTSPKILEMACCIAIFQKTHCD